jgi:hypothetical protein
VDELAIAWPWRRHGAICHRSVATTVLRVKQVMVWFFPVRILTAFHQQLALEITDISDLVGAPFVLI